MSAPATASDRAIERHNAAMRRQNRIYVIVLAVVVVAGAIIVGRVWATGEVNNTALHTAAHPPADIPLGAPAASPTLGWHTTDRAAHGQPVRQGTVITTDQHTVRGRDARTGRVTWSYERSDRTLCDAVQAGGTTVAIYEVNGNCDEVTALNSRTGARRWTRTLDEDGHPVNGHPSVAVTPFTLMVTTSATIYAIDIAGGSDRWTFHQSGCSIQSAVYGSDGALISQTCTGQQCTGLQFCGNGPQLLLRDGYDGRADDSDSKNTDKDRIKWNKIGDTDVPVSSDDVISALNRTTRQLDVLNSSSGADLASITLPHAPASVTGAIAGGVPGVEYIWIEGNVYSVRANGKLDWTLASLGAPDVLDQDTDTYALGDGTTRLSLTVQGGVSTPDPATGKAGAMTTLPTPAIGSTAYPIGTGFLIAGPDGCAVYS